LVVEDFTSACQSIGHVDVVHIGNNDYDVRKRPGTGKYNPIETFLRQHGIFGKNALQKSVPDVIFSLERHQIALFLNRLFACDGWACVSNSDIRPHGNPQVGYSTPSERLARDIQHLLLRFGILSNLTFKEINYKGKRRPFWQLLISRKEDIEIFAREIGIFGKELDVEEVLITARRNEDHGN